MDYYESRLYLLSVGVLSAIVERARARFDVPRVDTPALFRPLFYHSE